MLQEDWRAAEALARDVLARNDGVAKMSTFRDAGLSNRQVAALHAQGLFDRPRNGWYVDPALSWQAKHAVRVGGILSCVSATDSFGLPTPPGSHRRLHVLVPLNSARVRHNRDKRHYVVPGEDHEVEVHWSTVGRAYRGWRTPLVDTLLLLVDCVPLEWWIAALDAALHRPRDGDPLLSAEDYAALADRVPRRLRKALRLIDPSAGSPLETLLRLGLVRRGIGPLTPQFSPDGRRFVDFLVGERLIVEADGAGFHDPDTDAERDRCFRGLNYTILRFSYDRIVHDLEAVLDEIEAALLSLAASV